MFRISFSSNVRQAPIFSLFDLILRCVDDGFSTEYHMDKGRKSAWRPGAEQGKVNFCSGLSMWRGKLTQEPLQTWHRCSKRGNRTERRRRRRTPTVYSANRILPLNRTLSTFTSFVLDTKYWGTDPSHRKVALKVAARASQPFSTVCGVKQEQTCGSA